MRLNEGVEETRPNIRGPLHALVAARDETFFL
jgi:hypothetical protein